MTGGSRGIGAATARLAALDGWAVAVNYPANSLAADEVVRAIRAAGGTALTVQARPDRDRDHASGGLPDHVRDLQRLVPMQRGGTADEVAQAIVWLLSGAASYTTMSLLDVSGGR